jgi:hypothetical protein
VELLYWKDECCEKKKRRRKKVFSSLQELYGYV